MKLNLFFKSMIVAIIAFAFSYGFYQFSDGIPSVSSSSQWIKYKMKLNYQTFVQTVSLENITSLEIDVKNSDISLHRSNLKEGKIEFTSSLDQRNTISSKEDKHTLLISINDKNNYSDSSLAIFIPDQVKAIVIHSKSGDINMKEISLNRLSINTISGNIKLNNIIADESFISTISGDLTWKGMSKQMQLKTVSGDVHINSSFNSPSYDITTVSGDVDLSFSQPIEAKLNLQSASGEVSTSDSISLSNQSATTTALIQVSSESGDIRVVGR